MIDAFEYQELEDSIQKSDDIVYAMRNVQNPCQDCLDKCFGMPDSCGKAIYKPGTNPREIKEKVKNMIINDNNVKYLNLVEYCEFEDYIFGIKWHQKNRKRW